MTTKTVLTTSWALIVPDAKAFIIENPTEFDAEVFFSTTTPLASDIGHKLMSGFGISRFGVTGAVYGRIHYQEVSTATPYLITSSEA